MKLTNEEFLIYKDNIKKMFQSFKEIVPYLDEQDFEDLVEELEDYYYKEY